MSNKASFFPFFNSRMSKEYTLPWILQKPLFWSKSEISKTSSLSEIFFPILNSSSVSLFSLINLTFSILLPFSFWISFLLLSNLLYNFSELFSSLVNKLFSIIISISSLYFSETNAFKSFKNEFEISLNLQTESDIYISI